MSVIAVVPELALAEEKRFYLFDFYLLGGGGLGDG